MAHFQSACPRISSSSLRVIFHLTAGEVLRETIDHIDCFVDNASSSDTSIRQHESTSPNEAAEFFRVLREMQSGDATNGQTWDGVSGLARHRDELVLVDHGLAGIDGIAQLLHAHLCTEAAGSSALGDHLADRLFYGLRALTTCTRAALARTFDVAGEQP